MPHKSIGPYPILDFVREPKPHYLDKMAADKRVLESVDRLLSLPKDELTIAIEATRSLIEQRDNRPCDDARLALEIDHASCFICNETLFYDPAQASRYARSEI